MEKFEILKNVEFVLMKDDATLKDYEKLCIGAKRYGVAAVCVPSSWVEYCRSLLPEPINVCAVIGFPSGNSLSDAKLFEAQLAIEHGANEIEVMADLGRILSTTWGGSDLGMESVRQEVERMRQVCSDGTALKLAICNRRLSPEQKVKLCCIASEIGVDYIKTLSSGRDLGSVREMKLLREHMGPETKLIVTELTDDATDLRNTKWFLEFGCDRVSSAGLLDALCVDAAFVGAMTFMASNHRGC